MATRKSRRCGALLFNDRDSARGASGPPTGVCWRVWAPHASRVDLVLQEDGQQAQHVLQRLERGYHELTLASIAEGQRYAYRLDGGPARPDPCSLSQPDGVDGFSAVVFPEHFTWHDQTWRGVARRDLVIYELHVGTFTPEGTFDAIVPRLQTLKELGITAIELMPVAQFSGTRNWGYDGALLYAVQNSYGGPNGLQRLVDACHAAGLGIILDVVYNHLGPEGNYLREFAPYFTDRYKTPWGDAVNYDDKASDCVREFVLENVRMWLDDFHIDGLRLDAVHAIYDMSAKHLLRAIREVADDVQIATGRAIHIIAESDLNDPKFVLPPERGGCGVDAQWADDFHHAVHAFLTGERDGYYMDYGDAAQLAAAFQTPFVYAGHYSPHRDRLHGAPVPPDFTGDRFVTFVQNHDQIGNRARGDRLSALLTPAQQRLAASMLLLSPYVPLLFMGEEYGEANPFPFFCSFRDETLVQAVREGRKREFAAFVNQGPIPDPQAVDTFASARLHWEWLEGTLHAGLRRLIADLLRARREWPALHEFRVCSAELLPDAAKATILRVRRNQIAIFFNLIAVSQPFEDTSGPILFSSEWSQYLGNRRGEEVMLHPWECIVTWQVGACT